MTSVIGNIEIREGNEIYWIIQGNGLSETVHTSKIFAAYNRNWYLSLLLNSQGFTIWLNAVSEPHENNILVLTADTCFQFFHDPSHPHIFARSILKAVQYIANQHTNTSKSATFQRSSERSFSPFLRYSFSCMLSNLVFHNKNVISGDATISKTLCESLYSLMGNKKYTDATLIVQGKEIEVHKAVLAAKSEVFDVMFSNNMKETAENCVEIDDIDFEVMNSFIEFIYTGKTDKIGDFSMDLFKAADKYGVDDLMSLCAAEIKKKLSLATALETLIFSDLHSSEEIKGASLKFVNANATEIIKSANWKDFAKTHPKLLEELYESIVNNQSTPTPFKGATNGIGQPSSGFVWKN